MCRTNFTAAVLLLAMTLEKAWAEDAANQIYKMCVPMKFFDDCLNLLKDPSEAGIRMECVSGRDRIECLELINQGKADVLAVDPEDMYVAYHMKNEDFRVISEFRTQAEKDAEFRYEGVILVKKSTKAASLKDLKGLKSCHTGFGRNVGYKIPITKLKKDGALTVPMDPRISATERELQALSQFFSKSCLVGNYSADAHVDQTLKKKYSNLCALCENPEKCNYPDKFSGYDGAIRCLDKGEGEVAFTKTAFIKKYFGLLGGNPEGNPEEFEYLCEDGSRRPITGPACSWAQRPWKGYISSTNTVKEAPALKRLQTRLDKFFENGLQATNKQAASNLLIESDLVLHEKQESVEPQQYLEKAGYKDVIERDGSQTTKLKFCVSHDIEFDKCAAMRRAAYSRDIRPVIDCVKASNCIDAVNSGKADVVALQADRYKVARNSDLKPLVYATFGDDNVFVAVIEPTLSDDLIRNAPITYDKTNARARNAALLLNKLRGRNVCETVPRAEMDQILIVNSKELNKHMNKQLICPNFEKKPVTEFRTCNFEANLPTAIFVRSEINPLEHENFLQAFVSLADKFGPKGKLEDVFEIFGRFRDGFFNVIFDEDTVEFVTEIKNKNINEQTYNDLNNCGRA